MRYYIDELLGEEEELLQGEDLVACLEEAGDEYTLEDYLAEEGVLQETTALYQSLQAYQQTYLPGILQNLCWDHVADLVARTSRLTSSTHPVAASSPAIPAPIPQTRTKAPWPRTLISLGTIQSLRSSPPSSKSAASPSTTRPSTF